MKLLKPSQIFVFIAIMLHLFSQAQIYNKPWKNLIELNDEKWFASNKAIQIAENVLLYQRDIGGWPKNIEMQKEISNLQKQKLLALKSNAIGCTIDNGATCQEMFFLSKVYKQNPDKRYKIAFIKGLDYLLKAQYDNGGWPQFYPLIKGYYSHITYNDDAMIKVLELLQELKNNSGFYSINPSLETLEKVKIAFDKGIDCIIKTQYKKDGELTAWCAQHDAITLAPTKGRAYELASLSGKESVRIVLLLMSIENPSTTIVNAIQSAINWFEKTKITGFRIANTFNSQNNKEDKMLVQDTTAKPLWARFIDLHTNKPFFCGRDGIKKETLAEIDFERRMGYLWYTQEPEEMLNYYNNWKRKQEIQFSNNYIIVDQKGTGDFTSIQEAINAIQSFPYERITIFIKNGFYREKLKIHHWNTNISLIGESREATIISFDDNFNKIGLGRNSTFHTYTMLIEANDFFASNLTIENTSGDVGQAISLSINANKIFLNNCNILGNQDTLYTAGEGAIHYFKNCYIEGTTDFIFGNATALFEKCVIKSKKNSYITAASTPKNISYGYVFKNCKLLANPNITQVYLGRPWRIYAKTVFINCEMEKHIKPEGWENWSKPEAEKTSFFAEFNCSGNGFQPQKRVKWSYQLKAESLEAYATKNILGADFYDKAQSWLNSIEKK